MSNVTFTRFDLVFDAIDSIEVSHNLDRENLGVQVIVDNVVRPDLIAEILPDLVDPKNRFTVKLVSPQTGYLQVLEPGMYRTGQLTAQDHARVQDAGHSTVEAEEVRISRVVDWYPVSVLAEVVSAGRYRIGWSYEWISEKKNKAVFVRVKVGDIVLHETSNFRVRSSSFSAPWYHGAGFGYVDLDDGEMTIELAIKADAHSKEIGIRRRCLEMWRVG